MYVSPAARCEVDLLARGLRLVEADSDVVGVADGELQHRGRPPRTHGTASNWLTNGHVEIDVVELLAATAGVGRPCRTLSHKLKRPSHAILRVPYPSLASNRSVWSSDHDQKLARIAAATESQATPSE